MKRLSYPIRSKYFERAGDNYVKVSLCSLQGRRINMEDSHLIRLTLPNHPEYHLFGIFDGHNGKGAAQYLSDHITDELDKLKDLNDAKAIQNCIMKMDKEFLRTEKSDQGSCMVFVLLQPIMKDQGSTTNKNKNQTADEAISDVTGYQVSVFWAGDSRCLWLSPDKSKGITKDHVPTNTQEKERIEKAEGSVVNKRVDARLAVSRAFGDSSLKDNTDKSLDKQKVVALCDYQTITASPGDWLFLFCDGLVEKANNEQIAERLKKYVGMYDDPAHALGYMFDEILNEGSGDNITGCLIQLQNGVEHGANQNKTFLPGPLYMAKNDPGFVQAYMDNAAIFGHFDNPKLRIAAYQEDLNWLKRFGDTDPDYNRMIDEIKDTIRQLRMSLGPNETWGKDTNMLSYDDTTDNAIQNKDKDRDTTNKSTMINKDIPSNDRDISTTGNTNRNMSTTGTSGGDIPSANKKRRITLDQWVYVYDNTI